MIFAFFAPLFAAIARGLAAARPLIGRVAGGLFGSGSGAATTGAAQSAATATGAARSSSAPGQSMIIRLLARLSGSLGVSQGSTKKAIDVAQFLASLKSSRADRDANGGKQKSFSELASTSRNFGDLMAGKRTMQDEQSEQAQEAANQELSSFKTRLIAGSAAMAGAGGAAYKFSQLMAEANRNLARFSTTISQAYARLDRERLLRQRQSAFARQASTRRLTESTSRMEDAWRPVSDSWANVWNTIAATLAEIMAFLGNVVGPILTVIGHVVNFVFTILRQIWKVLNVLVELVRKGLEWLWKIFAPWYVKLFMDNPFSKAPDNPQRGPWDQVFSDLAARAKRRQPGLPPIQ